MVGGRAAEDQCVKTSDRACCCSVLIRPASQAPRGVFLFYLQDDGTETGAGDIKPRVISSGEEPGLKSGWLTSPLPVFPAALDKSYRCFCSLAQRGQRVAQGHSAVFPRTVFPEWISGKYGDWIAVS